MQGGWGKWEQGGGPAVPYTIVISRQVSDILLLFIKKNIYTLGSTDPEA